MKFNRVSFIAFHTPRSKDYYELEVLPWLKIDTHDIKTPWGSFRYRGKYFGWKWWRDGKDKLKNKFKYDYCKRA